MALSDEILADLKAKKGGGGKMPMPPMRGKAEPADTGDAEPDAADAGEGSEYAGDEESIASDIMAAKDPASFADALKSFLDVCVPKIIDGMKGGME